MSRLGRVFVSFIAILVTLFSLTGFSQAGLVSLAGATAVKQPDFLSGGAADPLDKWLWRNPLPSGNFYSAVTYGNGMFVAVDGGCLLTSSDGITWSETASGPGLSIWGIAYGNGIFVAVGGKFNYWKSDEIGTPVLYVSHDGITWTAADTPLSRGSLRSVAYGDGRFVAVGTGRSIIVSSGGSSWATARATNDLGTILNTGLFGIVYGNGLFVAAGFGRDGGSLSIGFGGGSILTSPDGMTWTERVNPDTDELFAAAYGKGTFVTAGRGAILTSPDGITWTERVRPVTITGIIMSIAYGNGLFVTADEGILTSPDGVDWTPQTLPFTNETADVRAVSFGNGLFVALGAAYDAGYVSRPVLLTSQDGVNWTERSSSITREHFRTVEYGNGTFVAMSSVGSIFTSPNGAKWTKSASSLDPLFQSVIYGGSKFVGVGFTGDYHGSVPVISTSTDGVDWNKKTLPVTDGALYSIVYGNGTFVAAGYYRRYAPDNSTHTVVSTILTSIDGDVWSPASLPDGIANGGIISVTYGNGLFVASGFDSESLALFTSPDGSTWTTHKSHSTTSEMYIWAYGNNLFVATEYFWLDPTGRSRTVILTSPDGLSWTKRYTLPDNVEMRSLRYGNGVFVGAGEGSLLSSSDGIRWTKRSALTPYNVRSLAYGNKTFVVVGSAGNIIQSSRLGNVVTVAREGSGSGKVTSSPRGVTCGTSCSATFIENATITLTATPAAGSAFTGWAGDCTGSGPCTVTMNKDIAVTATFVALPVLGVAPASLNFGRIKKGGSSPAKMIRIKNTGARGSLLNIAAPVISGPNSAEFTAISSCAAPLAKGESCLISVTFSPQSDGTLMSANLEITSDAPTKGSATVKLKGRAG